MTASQSPRTLLPAASRRDSLPSEFVFAYGTLKRGFERHGVLKRSLYVGRAFTKSRFPLVVFDPLPVLINRPHKGKHVWGEVYKVSRNTLGEIDQIEGHPQLYKRERIAVTLFDNRDQAVWVYFLNEYHVPDGVWQGLPFLNAYTNQIRLP